MQARVAAIIKMKDYHNRIAWLVGWLVVLRIYFALAIFQLYRDLETGDNQGTATLMAHIDPVFSLRFWRIWG